MRLTVWKYVWPLPATRASFDMPLGAEILRAREQDNNVCIWARVDADEPRRVSRTFELCGTGHKSPAEPYIGTALLDGGALVLHVFGQRV